MSMFPSHHHALVAGLLIGAFVGLIIGGAIVGFSAEYVLEQVVAGNASESALFGGLIEEWRSKIVLPAAPLSNQAAAYGTVTAAGDEQVTIETDIPLNGTTSFTFFFAPSTEFVDRSAAATSTDAAFDRQAIAVGDILGIETAEAIGSVTPQYAAKVVRY